MVQRVDPYRERCPGCGCVALWTAANPAIAGFARLETSLVETGRLFLLPATLWVTLGSSRRFGRPALA